MIRLRGVTWNHSRGYTPMAATAQRFSELNPSAEVVWEKRTLQEFADQPIDQLADQYDLLVSDHPWTGFASAAGLLLFQDRAATSIRDYMRVRGGERALLDDLDRLYHESRKGGQP